MPFWAWGFFSLTEERDQLSGGINKPLDASEIG